MKRQNLLLILVFVLVAGLLLVGVAAAKTTRTEFTGMETQIGGADPLRYWEAGQTVHIREMTGVYWGDSTDPRLVGENHVVININFHPAPEGGIQGEMWGTSFLQGENGYWEGTWQGRINPDGSTYYDAHSNGGGGYEGLKVFLHAENGVYSGYILDPGK